MRKKIAMIFFYLITVMMWWGCESEEPDNPYDDLEYPSTSNAAAQINIPEGNFAWLHAKVFKPTCSNSGCHDGTFEPDFRTIAGSYNSLVYQPVIANDQANSFEFRVIPGNHQSSWLHERLTVDVINTSGMMPLVVDTGSTDWITQKNFYIEKIKAWIDSGAPDMYGNLPVNNQPNPAPLVYGMLAFPNGNTTNPYEREQTPSLPIGSVLINSGLVDFWFVAFDNIAGLTNYSSFTVKASSSLSNFENAVDVPCVLSSPVQGLDFTGSPAMFYYKATLDFSALPSGETMFLRVNVSDGVQTLPTEVPNESSNYFWYLLFSVKAQ